MPQLSLNYFLNKKNFDIYKGIKVDNLVICYIKYRKVGYQTERRNGYGFYDTYSYPFESYLKSNTATHTYFEPFGTFLPNYHMKDLFELNQYDALVSRLYDNSTQMWAIREMFNDFKNIKGFDLKKMGLDASLQCWLETPSSDIDLVVTDATLYLNIYNFILRHKNYELFSHKLVERRGAYSTFITSKELEAFEHRKISYLYKGIKTSILYTMPATIPEYLTPTGAFIFIKAAPHINKSIGEPSILELSDYEVLYGPNIGKGKLYYLSVLPVRTGFILKEEDELYITGYLYSGVKSNKYYITQFTWDYCSTYSKHHIALNTYLKRDDDDKKLIAHFYENLKL